MNEWVRLQVQGDEVGEVGHLFDLIEQLNSPWRREASCRGLDPNLFFPERGESSAEAKAVCRSCPVRVECADYSVATGQAFGIWGGTSQRERRRLRKAAA